MKWDLVDMDPNYSFFFNLIVLLQALFFLFIFFSFVNLIVDILATKKKLYAMKMEFKEVSEKELLKDKLLVQKEKYRMNSWLMPIIDHLYFYGENKNLNDQRIRQEKLFSAFAGKISKNSYFFKFIMFFSLSSVFFAFYEVNASFDLDRSDILKMIILSFIIIAITIAIFRLKKHFGMVLKKYIVDLQMILSNGKS